MNVPQFIRNQFVLACFFLSTDFLFIYRSLVMAQQILLSQFTEGYHNLRKTTIGVPTAYYVKDINIEPHCHTNIPIVAEWCFPASEEESLYAAHIHLGRPITRTPQIYWF